MTYILLWIICATCSFYLLRNYVSSNLRLVGIPDASIAVAMRNAAKRDESVRESELRLYDCPDHILNALFWTILLVENLLLWPVTLVMLVWWQTIDKQDFSDFRG